MQNSQTRTLCLNATPVGTPTQIPAKIQIKTCSSSTYLASTVCRPSNNSSDKQSAGTKNILLVKDNVEMWPPPSRKPVGDAGTPRSLAPVSLEDLVKFKPGRGRNGKGGKWVSSLESDFDKDANQESEAAFETNNHNDNAGASEMLLSQTFIPSHNITHFQPNPVQLAMPRQPSFQAVPTSHQDEDFFLETLPNGDLSVSQYSETQNEWVLLGQIDKSEVSFFTRFYDRSYSDNRANPENCKLYKAHIVATVKQLSDKRRKALQSWESTQEFRPGNIQHNPALPQTNGIQWSFQPRSILAHQSIESFPSLPNSVQEFAAIPEPDLIRDARPFLQPSRSGERRQMLLSIFRSQPRDPTDMANKIDSEISGQSAPRELKRSQTQEDMLLQRHQNDVTSDYRLKRESIVSSVCHSPPVKPWNQSRESLGMRRTVLHDPLKSNTYTTHPALRQLQSQPKLTTIQGNQALLKSSLRPETTISSQNSSSGIRTATNKPLHGLVRDSVPDFTSSPVFQCSKVSVPRLNSNFDFKGINDNDSETCTYETALDNFWFSGTLRYGRQMNAVDKLRTKSPNSWSEQAEISYRILIPLLEALEEYHLNRKVDAAGDGKRSAPLTEQTLSRVESSNA